MNAAIPESTKIPTTSDVEQRIRDERNRLPMEQNLEANLNNQRLAPLEAGDDEALDRVEAQIGQCQDRQCRIQERLEILERRLAEARAREKDAEIDALYEQTANARAAGVKLVTKVYPALAEKMGALLKELAETEAQIIAANFTLSAAGREPFESVNWCRVIPAQQDGGVYVPAHLPEALHTVITLPSVEPKHDVPAYHTPPMDGRTATLLSRLQSR